MKKLLSLLLALLLLTGCAAQLPVDPESQSTNTVPETDVVESTSVTEESDPKENATEESVPTEELSTPEDSTPADIVSEVISLEEFDLLVRLQQYDWFGEPEADGPGVDFGTVPLTADQQAELAVLLHPNLWKPAEDLPPVGINETLCLESSTTGERLSICPWDGATLVMLASPHPSGVTALHFRLAPIWLNDDAQRYMYDAAYASWPNPQTMRDLSPLCRYPNAVSEEFAAHLKEMEPNTTTAVDPNDIHYTACWDIYRPYLYSSLLPVVWENADTLPADNLMRFFAAAHFNHYVGSEEFLIDALIVEPFLQQFYSVSTQHLRTAEIFIRDAGCYRFHGMDGSGGIFPFPAALQRTGENCWRMYTAFDVSFDSTPQMEYSAFEFELTDTGFRYLRGLGNVAADQVPLPIA